MVVKELTSFKNKEANLLRGLQIESRPLQAQKVIDFLVLSRIAIGHPAWWHFLKYRHMLKAINIRYSIRNYHNSDF